MKKWVCQTDKTHVFDECSEDGFCSFEPLYHGILLEEEVPSLRSKELCLCVMLMDASASMTGPVFEGTSITRMRFVSNSAASGIFDLAKKKEAFNIYIACFKFDDRVKLMFVDSVANITDRFKITEAFANYLFNELFEFQQGTDINNALQQAYLLVKKFLNKQLDEFPVTDYTAMMQRILKYNSADMISIPNIRVLLYTDGMQYDSSGNKTLNPNPFKQNILTGLNHDILICAYLGSETDEGCSDLRNLVSHCPIHNSEQFFLFDKPSDMGKLYHLFRMASSASGFCPRCLEKQFEYSSLPKFV